MTKQINLPTEFDDLMSLAPEERTSLLEQLKPTIIVLKNYTNCLKIQALDVEIMKSLQQQREPYAASAISGSPEDKTKHIELLEKLFEIRKKIDGHIQERIRLSEAIDRAKKNFAGC